MKNINAKTLATLANTVRSCGAKYHANLSDADVEDCVQDGIMKACITFDATKGSEETHAKVCVYQATVDFLRKRTVARDAFMVSEVSDDEGSTDVYETLASDATRTDDSLATREAIGALQAFRATLGAKDAAMLDAMLASDDTLDCQAYALQTGEKLGTVKTRFSRLRASLREWHAAA